MEEGDRKRKRKRKGCWYPATLKCYVDREGKGNRERRGEGRDKAGKEGEREGEGNGAFTLQL